MTLPDWWPSDKPWIIGDCMNVMAKMPDKCVNLCLTDPPYGVNIVGKNGKIGGDKAGKCRDYIEVDGDDIGLTKEQWEEIKRISKNQVIWGGNYFASMLGDSPCWLVWNKRPYGNSSNFADCELAWTSFKTPSRVFHYLWRGMISWGEENRVHPTQKPIALFEWIINNYSGGGIVFDPFLGSGTTLLACRKTGRTGLGCEISPKYEKIIANRSMLNIKRITDF